MTEIEKMWYMQLGETIVCSCCERVSPPRSSRLHELQANCFPVRKTRTAPPTPVEHVSRPLIVRLEDLIAQDLQTISPNRQAGKRKVGSAFSLRNGL